MNQTSIDVVYSSHFLEHLSQEQANFVLSESKRVLRDNGILRVVVPDLENICREYIKILDLVSEHKNYEEQYTWITVELLDQLVRMKGGGKMGEMFEKIISTKNTKLAEYVLSRTGGDLLRIVPPNKRKITYDKIKNKCLYTYLSIVRCFIPKNLRNLIFINTSIGERHQWMYDEFSLKKNLHQIGFKNLIIKSHNTSDITSFNQYCLDIKEDGTSYKGCSSLYIEAKK